MGSGVVIVPNEGKVYAPVSGEVIVLPPSKHAVGIKTRYGMEVLLHVGLDSNKIENEFCAYIKEGQKVQQGDLLITFDKKALKKKAYATDTLVIITNSKEYTDVIASTQKNVCVGDNLLIVI